MKRINFLPKLMKEGKLQTVEPSEEIKEAYIRKSQSSLRSAKILLDNDQIEDAVPMAYYSMYHMLTALLRKTGKKSENHTASIVIMKELFHLENADISNAKKERVDKQYYVDFEVTKKEVEEMMVVAERFIPIIYDIMERMTEIEHDDYLSDFTDAMGLG